MNNNRLGNDGVIDLARYLSKTVAPKLRERVLTLRDNCVGTAGITALTGSDFLEHLTILDLAGNRLSSSGVVALVQRFGHGAHALEELQLSGSEISGDDAVAIGNALAEDALPKLEKLRLRTGIIPVMQLRPGSAVDELDLLLSHSRIMLP